MTELSGMFFHKEKKYLLYTAVSVLEIYTKVVIARKA